MATTTQQSGVWIRDWLNKYGSKYGISDTDIGWNGDTKSVQLGGADWFKPASVVDGKSYADPNQLSAALDTWATQNNKTDYSQPYKSPYADDVEKLITQINNSSFSYNPDTDPAYASYRDKFSREGQSAQGQTMADLSAATGGRPSSYAAAATAQTGQAYAQKIADAIPALMEAAYGRYQGDQNKLMQMLGTYMNLDEQGYNRFTNDRNFMEGKREFDLNTAEGKRQFDTQFGYQVSRDKIMDQQWLKQFNAQEAQRLAQLALDKKQISLSEYNAVTSRISANWAKDPTNPDNKYKEAQIQAGATSDQAKEDAAIYDTNYNQALPKFDAMDPNQAIAELTGSQQKYDYYEGMIGTDNMTKLIMYLVSKKSKTGTTGSVLVPPMMDN